MTESESSVRFAEAFDAMNRRVIERITGKPYDEEILKRNARVWVIYSAYKTADDDVPIDNLDDVAFVGQIQFAEGVNYWNEFPWESKVLENPTWLDLCVVANDKIKTTKDRHHVYLEGISVHGVDFAGVTRASLSMGS